MKKRTQKLLGKKPDAERIDYNTWYVKYRGEVYQVIRTPYKEIPVCCVNLAKQG